MEEGILEYPISHRVRKRPPERPRSCNLRPRLGQYLGLVRAFSGQRGEKRSTEVSLRAAMSARNSADDILLSAAVVLVRVLVVDLGLCATVIPKPDERRPSSFLDTFVYLPEEAGLLRRASIINLLLVPKR